MSARLAGAEPFTFTGSRDVGALLVHGFTGTASEMRPIGEHLAEHGIGSAGILLSGHGTHPNDMLGYRYEDWLADSENALDELLRRYARVFLVGLSMGGTIGLNLAARRARDPRIAGVVSICAPLHLTDWRLQLVPILKLAVRWQAWGRPDIKDTSAWERHVGYRRFRPGAVLELLRLLRDTRDRLAAVNQPVLVVQSRDDNTVPRNNAIAIYQGVGSAVKSLLWLENCYHVATLDYDAPLLNAEVTRFVEAQAGSPVGPADERLL